MIPVALTAAVAPVRLFAPRPEPVAGPATVAELIAACRATGSTGRALADAAVQRALNGATPRKLIVVPDRIVNVVL